jgi:uncharacterized glyoxalase superfamily protein PhnB
MTTPAIAAALRKPWFATLAADACSSVPCPSVCVDDADAVAAGWWAAGAEVHGPQDTECGQHEGAVIDPDGNVIRFGSPVGIPKPSSPP